MVKNVVQGLCVLFLLGYGVSCSSPGPQGLPKADAKSARKKQRSKARTRTVIDHKAVRKIQRRQAKRAVRIFSYKAKGYVGEMSDGQVGVVPGKKMSAKARKNAKKIVAYENRDRKALFRRIASDQSFGRREIQIFKDNYFKAQREADPKKAAYAVDGQWQK